MYTESALVFWSARREGEGVGVWSAQFGREEREKGVLSEKQLQFEPYISVQFFDISNKN